MASKDVSNENTRIVQQGFDAFNKGDIESLINLFADDIDWEVLGEAGRVPTGGQRRGKNEVRRFFRDVEDSFDFSVFEVNRMVAQGDHVVALGHSEGTAKPTGQTFSTQWAMVFTLRDGKIVTFREYGDTATLAEAFGAELRTGTTEETHPETPPDQRYS